MYVFCFLIFSKNIIICVKMYIFVKAIHLKCMAFSVVSAGDDTTEQNRTEHNTTEQNIRNTTQQALRRVPDWTRVDWTGYIYELVAQTPGYL